MNALFVLKSLPKAVFVAVIVVTVLTVSTLSAAIAGTLIWAVANGKNVEFGWPTKITAPEPPSQKKCQEVRLAYEANQRAGNEQIKALTERASLLDQQVVAKGERYADSIREDKNVCSYCRSASTNELLVQLNEIRFERRSIFQETQNVRHNMMDAKVNLDRICFVQ